MMPQVRNFQRSQQWLNPIKSQNAKKSIPTHPKISPCKIWTSSIKPLRTLTSFTVSPKIPRWWQNFETFHTNTSDPTLQTVKNPKSVPSSFLRKITVECKFNKTPTLEEPSQFAFFLNPWWRPNFQTFHFDTCGVPSQLVFIRNLQSLLIWQSPIVKDV